ncbi:MAG: TonB-dependent receptor plug domain-containing protein [Acidobacteria bacterium]|nr:TonB-dependent receptor plug domain-containing protein [Acidobacteriota bacterium]
MAGARLRLSERSSGALRQTRSDQEGAYEISGTPRGSYLIEAEAADEALLVSQPVEIEGDIELDLQLALSGPKADVLVTASSTPLSVHEIAKAVDVVDSEQIALRDEFALSEALRSVPGLRVRQLRGPGGQTTIQTRGLRTQDTAVLIDGLRFRDAAATQGDASGVLSDMNLIDADRVEVLRGSGSSLYGSHAMGGVVNIRSSEGGGKTHGDIRAEGGGLGMLRGVARVGGGLADDRFVYSGGFSHLNVTQGLRNGSPHRDTGGQAFARYRFTPKVAVTGRVWGADVFTNTNESPAFPAAVLANFPVSGPVRAIPVANSQLKLYETGRSYQVGDATFMPDAIDPDSRRVSSFVAAAVALEQQLSPNGSYRLAYQLVDTNRSFQDGPAGPGDFEPHFSNDSRFDGRIHLFQARTNQQLGQYNLVTVGYELEREEFENLQLETDPAASSSRIGIQQSSHALFAQDQIRLLDGRFQVALSGRAQRFDLSDPVFQGADTPYKGSQAVSPPSSYTGDVSTAYFFRGSETKLRAHLGNSYRAPSSYERFGGSFYLGSASYYGDPRLAPERSISVDGGVDQWLARGKARLSGTLYYTALQETILYDFANFPVATDPYGRFGGYRNGGGGIARGVEVSGQLSPVSGTSVQASYTYTNSDSRTPTIGTDFFTMLGVSTHMFNLTATQWIAKRFNVTFDLFAVSDYSFSPYGANGRRMIFAGPAKADIVLRYDLPVSDSHTVEIYGKVENFFNNVYYENGFQSPGAWAIGGMRFRF